jgi:hypothetical protein
MRPEQDQPGPASEQREQLPAPAEHINGDAPAPAKAKTLHERVLAAEATTIGHKLCQKGELYSYVLETVGKQYEGGMDDWPAAASEAVKDAIKDFRKTGRPITPELVKELDEQMARTGETWTRVHKSLAAKKLVSGGKMLPAELNIRQAQAAIDALKAMPDAQAGE